MRILFITRKHPPSVGGMQNLSYNLIQNFLKQGRERGDQIETIILNRSQWHLFWWFPYALFLTLAKARTMDIVHLGDPVLSLIGFLARVFYHKAVVVTIHGLDVTFNLFLYQWYLKLFGRKFDRYICISSYALEEARKVGFSPCAVIPVGVDTNKLKVKSARPQRLASSACMAGAEKLKVLRIAFYKKYNLPRDQYYLLTVGRLVRRKGVYWFIDRVLSTLSPNIIYLVVGEGPERERIKTLIQERGLEKRVYLLGKISEEDLKIVYSLADLFIMPNIKVQGDVEGFGLVAVEAAQNGLPVIAAGIEGIRDAVISGRNGILVESENSAAFQKKILEFLRNQEYRKSFGDQAAQFTRETYDWQIIAKRYYEEFLKVISS
ncbi:MAG: glycosyltransferase family 4 protein [Patescibacteria group bacterium]|nr:glycosyltransferase family 4 protein [Patescibacteria group bacterium]